MQEFILFLKNAQKILMTNLFDFHLTLDNPWIWIYAVIFFFVFLNRWGIKKLALFMVIVGLLIFGKMKVEARMASAGLIRPDNYTLMLENMIFYIILGVVLIYFIFIKE